MALNVIRRASFHNRLLSCYSCRSTICCVEYKLLSRRYMSYRRMMIENESKTAYFMNEDTNQFFSVSLKFIHPPLGINKVFTLNRSMDSSIGEMLERLNLKLFTCMSQKTKKKVSFHYEVSVPEIRSVMYYNGEQLPDCFVCSEIFHLDGDIRLNVLDETYSVVCNSPWVKSIGLPHEIFSDMLIFPLKFEVCFTNKNNCSFTWFRSFSEHNKRNAQHLKDWLEIGNDFFYLVKEEDIGSYIKFTCVPKSDRLVGPVFTEIIETRVKERELNYYFSKTHLLTNKRTGNDEMRIITYNVLAEMYVRTKEGKEIFDYCSSSSLNSFRRQSAITKEITGYNADIICLQEVEMSFYKRYLIPFLEDLKYSGFLNPKFGDREGTAIFYFCDKFNFVGSCCFNFGQQVSTNNYLKDVFSFIKQKNEFYEKFSSLPHSIQFITLQSRNNKRNICVVGNLHLYSSPEAELIRLLQVISSFCLFECYKKEIMMQMGIDKLTFILCGDFNSTPECAVHELVMNGSIPSAHKIWKSGEMKKCEGISYSLPYKMNSALGEPRYTNYTRLFKGCLDYIYYMADDLEVTNAYSLPSEEELSAEIGLPSKIFPSDHIPLIADLKWKI